MSLAATALWLMVIAFGAGAAAGTLARTDRLIRLITGVAGAFGAACGLAASLAVLVSGQPVDAAFPQILAPAGGLAIHLDRLGAVFLALVAGVSLPAAFYGVAYTAAYEGRYSLRLFGVMFNGFLAGMSLVPCAANVFSFLLAWELMALTSYFLVMTESDHVETRQAGHWYIAMTHAGFVLLLPMFLLMAPSIDATAFADWRAGAAGGRTLGRVRPRPAGVRVESRRRTAACLAAARASRGAVSRIGAHVGRDDQAGHLRSAARHARFSGTGSGVVGRSGPARRFAVRAGWGALRADRERSEAPAGIFLGGERRHRAVRDRRRHGTRQLPASR